MFDNLREDASSSPFFNDEPPEEGQKKGRGSGGLFLGMTAPQRLVIAVLLLMMVCVLGSLCLLLTDKVMLPF
jgi:hypothetical protein